MGTNPLDRRGFLRAVAGGAAVVGTSAAGMTALAVPAQANARLFPPGRIGIQLWTVRNAVQQIGFRRVFERLAKLGFTEVEPFTYDQTQQGLPPVTVAEIKQALDDNGLRAVGVHRGMGRWRDHLEEELDAAEILGVRYVGTADPPEGWGGATPSTVDIYRRAADEFNEVGRRVATRGLRFFQHNHEREFRYAADQPDTVLFDVFLAHTDPRLVYLQLDLFHAYEGLGLDGNPADLVDYVLADPRRYPTFHVKDGQRDPDTGLWGPQTPYGEGDVPMREFFSALRGKNYHAIWEQGNAEYHDDGRVDIELGFARAARSVRRMQAERRLR
ncbi:sugar phosphate isomerase/epimerase family protein [Phytoactinopolyspora limicola]|uniref:sugar phosphate isomerase/epimerase family protein n=1 Tax=Phytoactinopolyspora limicola TaxID=2715536 RepID=UPI0014076349|nr:sugar phosphate isomerase/epimerase family protein [Phytoactinopolyspora limicola]